MSTPEDTDSQTEQWPCFTEFGHEAEFETFMKVPWLYEDGAIQAKVKRFWTAFNKIRTSIWFPDTFRGRNI
jgi:hypothetical protein